MKVKYLGYYSNEKYLVANNKQHAIDHMKGVLKLQNINFSADTISKAIVMALQIAINESYHIDEFKRSINLFARNYKSYGRAEIAIPDLLNPEYRIKVFEHSEVNHYSAEVLTANFTRKQVGEKWIYKKRNYDAEIIIETIGQDRQLDGKTEENNIGNSFISEQDLTDEKQEYYKKKIEEGHLLNPSSSKRVKQDSPEQMMQKIIKEVMDKKKGQNND